MTNEQKDFIIQLAENTNWIDAAAIKTASENFIDAFQKAYHQSDTTQTDGLEEVMYRGLYLWMDTIMDYFQEHNIDGNKLWDLLLSHVHNLYSKGLENVLASYMVFAQAARQYSVTQDIANLRKVLFCMHNIAFEKHEPYSLNCNMDDLCERMTRIVFANTFRQLNVQIFANENLKADFLMYIEGMKRSRVIGSYQELITAIETCEQYVKGEKNI